jgi:hypothetical protein
VIRGCSLYRNRQNGILRGAAPNSQRVVIEGNHEFENTGLPPDMTALLAAGKKGAAQAPRAPEKNPKPGSRQEKKEGGYTFPLLEEMKELNSGIPTRQHQKYLKRCGCQFCRKRAEDCLEGGRE